MAPAFIPPRRPCRGPAPYFINRTAAPERITLTACGRVLARPDGALCRRPTDAGSAVLRTGIRMENGSPGRARMPTHAEQRMQPCGIAASGRWAHAHTDDRTDRQVELRAGPPPTSRGRLPGERQGPARPGRLRNSSGNTWTSPWRPPARSRRTHRGGWPEPAHGRSGSWSTVRRAERLATGYTNARHRRWARMHPRVHRLRVRRRTQHRVPDAWGHTKSHTRLRAGLHAAA
jgi:hypothetical protein